MYYELVIKMRQYEWIIARQVLNFLRLGTYYNV